jgi:hypothetical protein
MLCKSMGTHRSKSNHIHAVKFYENPASLSRIVAEFLSEGLKNGQPALMITTPEHRAAIVDAFTALHIDADAAQANGTLLVLDASQTLTRFMINGMPDAARFHEVASAALSTLCAKRPDCTIRAYGEMVDVLWKQGHDAAAIRLEMLWNRLAMTHEFALLCGYSMGNFYKDAGRAAIHHQHTHIVTDSAPQIPAAR